MWARIQAVSPAFDEPEPAMGLYGRLLAMAFRGEDPDARLRFADGDSEPLPVARWLADASPADQLVLRGAAAPVLDVGCGPGRLLGALESSEPAMGIDLSPIAVQLAARRGTAIAGCVFATPMPACHATVLLLDGNVGIGGAPVPLLRRCAELLAPGGRVLVELGAPGSATRTGPVRLEGGGAVSDWFQWALVSVDAIGDVAGAAGMHVERTLHSDERWFAHLRVAP